MKDKKNELIVIATDKCYTEDELENMNLDTARDEVCGAIYEASGLFEILEGKGKIYGNGHHIRQELSRFAMQLMEDYWKKN